MNLKKLNKDLSTCWLSVDFFIYIAVCIFRLSQSLFQKKVPEIQVCLEILECHIQWFAWYSHRTQYLVTLTTLIYFFIFFNTESILYWSIGDWQCCDSFRWTVKGLSHTYTLGEDGEERFIFCNESIQSKVRKEKKHIRQTWEKPGKCC